MHPNHQSSQSLRVVDFTLCLNYCVHAWIQPGHYRDNYIARDDEQINEVYHNNYIFYTCRLKLKLSVVNAHVIIVAARYIYSLLQLLINTQYMALILQKNKLILHLKGLKTAYCHMKYNKIFVYVL